MHKVRTKKRFISWCPSLVSGNKVLSEQDEIMKELQKYYSEQFMPPLIDYADVHDVKIDTEYNEILRILTNSEDQMERTNTNEIIRVIRSLKPKKISRF